MEEVKEFVGLGDRRRTGPEGVPTRTTYRVEGTAEEVLRRGPGRSSGGDLEGRSETGSWTNKGSDLCSGECQ